MKRLPISEKHKNNNQYPFKNHPTIKLESFTLHRDNKFTKIMINNRHDIVMTKYNNAGYGYQIFYGQKNIGSIWLLNQVNAKTTYVRVSRYESYASGYFIAVLSELSDLLEEAGYSLLLKTKIEFAQDILDKNFYSIESKKSRNKRGKNDRSTRNTSVDGKTYYIHLRNHTYDKWHNEKAIIDA